jgi:hypothetical protein
MTWNRLGEERGGTTLISLFGFHSLRSERMREGELGRGEEESVSSECRWEDFVLLLEIYTIVCVVHSTSRFFPSERKDVEREGDF